MSTDWKKYLLDMRGLPVARSIISPTGEKRVDYGTFFAYYEVDGMFVCNLLADLDLKLVLDKVQPSRDKREFTVEIDKGWRIKFEEVLS